MSKERMTITIELEADNVTDVYGDISKALHKLNKDLPISITSIQYALKNVADKEPNTNREDVYSLDYLYAQALKKHANAGGQFYWDRNGLTPINYGEGIMMNKPIDLKQYQPKPKPEEGDTVKLYCEDKVIDCVVHSIDPFGCITLKGSGDK